MIATASDDEKDISNENENKYGNDNNVQIIQKHNPTSVTASEGRRDERSDETIANSLVSSLTLLTPETMRFTRKNETMKWVRNKVRR